MFIIHYIQWEINILTTRVHRVCTYHAYLVLPATDLVYHIYPIAARLPTHIYIGVHFLAYLGSKFHEKRP